jgi:integrase
MALSMSRPFKHPDTGMYWLRKRVPDDLKAVIGKSEVKKTLGTKDPLEAKRLHTAALAEIEAEWAALRKGVSAVLTEAMVDEFETAIFERWLAHHDGGRKVEPFWATRGFEDIWEPVRLLNVNDGTMSLKYPAEHPPSFPANYSYDDPRLLEDTFDNPSRLFAYQCGDEYAVERGLQVGDDDRLRLAKAAIRGIRRASQQMKPRLGWGESSAANVDTRQVAITSSKRTIAPAAAGKSLSFSDLLEGWARERKPVEKTVYSYKSIIDALKAFLGFDDALRLTADDLIAWKNHLIGQELSGKTIRDAKLAPVRAMLQWAVDNRLLVDNVAERITINVKVAQTKRKRSYTDDEAKVVLAAARKAKDPVRRWVPFLAAYSGARIAELCQLRAEDIRTIHDIPCMVFAAEAGSLKNANSERALPLHPALISEGFLAFAATIKQGPLFADLDLDRFGSRGGNGSKVLSRWVRSIGLKDERLSPNHSWRHRLKTLGRRYGLALDNVNAITGHGRKDVAAHYGEYEMRALLRELEKIPDLMKEPLADTADVAD